MQTYKLAIAALAAIAALFGAPAAADAASFDAQAILAKARADMKAADAGFRPDCSKRLIRSANHHRRVVVKRHGSRAAGRDIIKWGRIGPNQRAHRVRDCKIVRRYRNQLVELHTEPRPNYGVLVRDAAPPARPPAGVETPTVDGIYGGGGWAIPEEIVMCESGGDYNAQNPSGAYGAYQIMPGTAAAYGCDLSTAAGQDQCAARIWNGGAGRGNWVC